MPGSSSDSSAQIAERIREDVEGSRPLIGPWSDDLRVTASIGIATGTGTSGEDLIARADEALYAAKRDGKNRVRRSPDAAETLVHLPTTFLSPLDTPPWKCTGVRAVKWLAACSPGWRNAAPVTARQLTGCRRRMTPDTF